MNDLNGKHALITGASTGIGKSIAQKLASSGVHVCLTARSEAKLKKVLQEIIAKGGSGEIIIADLSKREEIQALVELYKKRFDTLDILVHAAGIWHSDSQVYADTPLEDFSSNVIWDTLTVGVTVPLLLCNQLIPIMPKLSTIIMVSGTFENGGGGWVPYYTSKRALEDFVVGLAPELKEKTISIIGISPSDTSTEAYAQHFPQYLDDAIDPLEIANFVNQLCQGEVRNASGEIFVLKKDSPPTAYFHY